MLHQERKAAPADTRSVFEQQLGWRTTKTRLILQSTRVTKYQPPSDVQPNARNLPLKTVELFENTSSA